MDVITAIIREGSDVIKAFFVVDTYSFVLKGSYFEIIGYLDIRTTIKP